MTGNPGFLRLTKVKAWRMLTRSFMTSDPSKSLLAYTPMLHARMFTEKPKYREHAFEPLRHALPLPADAYHQSQLSLSDYHLDGNPLFDRPLFVQFCANSPDDLLQAALSVQPFCDAVDLNLGCPQGIARKGRYGAFLQEDWDLIHNLINKLHKELSIPVTAKMRVLETKEKTLAYAKMILSAGASIITVHGRKRDQKGHNTGLADWTILRYLKEQLPSDTVIFANGNILQHEDIEKCLAATGADAVMSAEGNLYDPSIFVRPPEFGQEGREYWRDRDGKGGYRMDAVFRRYMDIIYQHVLECSPPARRPLFLTSDVVDVRGEQEDPLMKNQRHHKPQRTSSPNLTAMQAHLFNILRPLVAKHTNIRDALAKSRSGDIAAFENVLHLVEEAVKQGLVEYERGARPSANGQSFPDETVQAKTFEEDPTASSLATIAKCKRPWWICQPYVRPLPMEAIKNGAMTLSKKGKARVEKDEVQKAQVGLAHKYKVESQSLESQPDRIMELPIDDLVCG